MSCKSRFYRRAPAPPAGNLERPLASSSALQHTSFICSGLWQLTRSHERNICEPRMPTKVCNEHHLQIADAREHNAATNDVICEERFGRG